MQPALANWEKPFIGAAWLFLRRGPGATNHFEGGGFARSNEEVAYPNLMFHFLPLAIRYDGTSPAGGHGYQVHVGPMYSDARGTVRLRSTDPTAKPALRFNYLSTDQDRREWVEAIAVARTHPGPAGVRGLRRRRGVTGPDGGVGRADPGLGRAGRGDRAPPFLHGEDGGGARCRGGPDLDAGARAGRVAGGRCVRVPVRAQRQHLRPVMMVAEKAADLIKGDTPLPPQHTPFYRHGTERVLPS